MKRTSTAPIQNAQNDTSAPPIRTTTLVHLVYRFDVGGLENGIVNLVNRLPRDQYHHHIICLERYNPDFFARISCPHVTIHALEKPPGKSRAYLGRLRRLLKELDPDIVHSRNLATLEGQVASLLAGIPARVHGEHGWDSAQAQRQFKPALLRRLYSPLVHRYIALSAEGADYLQRKIGISPSRIEQICNGVDTEKFAPNEQRGQEVNAGAPLVIGAVGRLARVKNHALLIRAFARLLKKQPDMADRARLVIVGDGPLRGELEQLIETEGLTRCVQLAGASNDIPQRMQQFDLFVQPSLAEGISNTILEAMASGLPVVSTDVGGARELIDNGVSGRLVANDDTDDMARALGDYLDAPVQIAQHGRQARQRAVSEFSIDGMVARYHALYQQLLRSNR